MSNADKEFVARLEAQAKYPQVWTSEDAAEANAAHVRMVELEHKRETIQNGMRADLFKVIDGNAKYHNLYLSLEDMATFIFRHRKEFRDILNRDQS